MYFGDFKADDLNNPRNHKPYCDIFHQTVRKFKFKIKMFHN